MVEKHERLIDRIALLFAAVWLVGAWWYGVRLLYVVGIGYPVALAAFTSGYCRRAIENRALYRAVEAYICSDYEGEVEPWEDLEPATRRVVQSACEIV